MRVILTTGEPDGAEVRLDVEPSLGVARHLDGVVFWRREPGFETFEDLLPSSPMGPYAPSGIVFCQVSSVDPSEELASLASRAFLGRGDPSDIKYGTWPATAFTMASIHWTDGAAYALSLLLRLAADIQMEIEYTAFRRRGEKLDMPTFYEDPLSLLRVIHKIEIVRECRSPLVQ